MRNKKMLGMLITAILLCSTLGIQERNVQASINILSESQKADIYYAIQKQLVDTYGDSYIFENFTYDIEDEKVVNGDRLVDINVYVDMTLTRAVSENVYVQGMIEKIKELDGAEKIFAEKELEHLTEDIEDAYNKPRNVQVLYTVKLQNPKAKMTNEFEIFSRIDFGNEDESMLTSIENIEESRVENTQEAFENGFNTFEGMNTQISSINESRAKVKYNRIAARDWARDNRSAIPEYSDANKYGSDCANFVSRAIYKGGIPQDPAGKWAHYSNGSTIEAFEYTNWIRTGKNDGGVVPYMLKKGYFFEETRWYKAIAGSIIYNTKRSHVGLVTSGDGVNVYYADHSSKRKYGRETLLQTSGDPYFESFKFYIPSNSILY